MRHRKAYCVGCRKAFAGCTCEQCHHEVRYGTCEECKCDETKRTEKRARSRLKEVDGKAEEELPH